MLQNNNFRVEASFWSIDLEGSQNKNIRVIASFLEPFESMDRKLVSTWK